MASIDPVVMNVGEASGKTFSWANHAPQDYSCLRRNKHCKNRELHLLLKPEG